MVNAPLLHLVCGKVAAGKSTLVTRLSAEPDTVAISEDVWLAALYAEEMETLADYMRNSARLQSVLAPHVSSLLRAGLSVVLDFPANTPVQRAALVDMAVTARVGHVLHFLDVPDDVCLARLARRNAEGAHPFKVSEDQFHRITSHFVTPDPAEGLVIEHH